jgi:hypothetical protein
MTNFAGYDFDSGGVRLFVRAFKNALIRATFGDVEVNEPNL